MTSSVADSLCFNLYLTSRMLTALYKPYLDPIALTFPQSLILGFLWEKDKQTIKELGQRLQLDSGTLSPLIKRLEKAGWVVRQRSDIDERSNYIVLTEQGKRLKPSAQTAHDKFYQQLSLNDNEVKTLNTILSKWVKSQQM